ncbi:unnamed protein product [Macrosiphum euphorbiae]|uniref:Uncharacterized protein n=1 Tax=Macrosiphum euphorbiae TaxID=13131 RepID=A0AAV0VZD2_9HEMI|nr:unnamed protein product [Macrosiphum euphorbiae]
MTINTKNARLIGLRLLMEMAISLLVVLSVKRNADIIKKRTNGVVENLVQVYPNHVNVVEIMFLAFLFLLIEKMQLLTCYIWLNTESVI